MQFESRKTSLTILLLPFLLSFLSPVVSSSYAQDASEGLAPWDQWDQDDEGKYISCEYDSDGNRVELPGAGGIHKGIAAAQGLASLSVIEGELPASEGSSAQIDGKNVNTSVLGLGLPSVGDKFVTLTMQLSLIFGTLLILTSGGMILLKKK